ncbi:MAG: hypothetical protein ACKOKB_01830 [Bacteroidota bacterium]
MTIRSIVFQIFFVSACFGMVGCNQDEEDVLPTPDPIPVDFRDELVGNYVGTKQQGSWSISNPIPYDTTYTYSFSVQKHSSAPDSIIVDGRTYPLDTTLSYYYSPYPGNIDQLDFRNDSCFIYLRSGGLGGYSFTLRQGRKQ